MSDSLIFDLKITPDRLPVLKLIYAKSECIGCCFCDTLMDKANSLVPQNLLRRIGVD